MSNDLIYYQQYRGITHGEAARRIMSHQSYEDQFQELVIYYPLLRSSRLYTRKESGEEDIKIFCGCDGCAAEMAERRPYYMQEYTREFEKATQLLTSDADLKTKFQYWISKGLDPFGRIGMKERGEDAIGVIPDDPKQVAGFNKLAYNHFKYGLLGIPHVLTLGGRIAAFEARMSRALYPEELLDKAKAAIKAEFSSKQRRGDQRLIFEELVNGSEMNWAGSRWNSFVCQDQVLAREAYLYLCYLEDYGEGPLGSPFLEYAAYVFGDDDQGMSWADITEFFSRKAGADGVVAPYIDPVFPDDGSIESKRAGIMANFLAFSPDRYYGLIQEMALAASAVSGRHQLVSRLESLYGPLSQSFSGVSRDLIAEVQAGLDAYGKAGERFAMAVTGIVRKEDPRHALDNLRLSLELFVRQLLGNEKSLENQLGPLGSYLKGKGVPGELRDMMITLIRLYLDYNNDNVKHGDKIEAADINTFLYLTATFIHRILKTAVT